MKLILKLLPHREKPSFPVDNKMEIDRTKHFDFLLKQTDIFTYLINNSIRSKTEGEDEELLVAYV